MSANSSRPKRFSFVTDELPRPGTAGHLAYNFGLISHLRSRGHRVDVFLTRPRLPHPITRIPEDSGQADHGMVVGPNLMQVGRFLIATEPRAAAAALARTVLPARLVRSLRARNRAGDAVLGDFVGPTEASWVACRIAAAPPDAILIDTIFRSPLMDQQCLAGMTTAIIAHDLFHRRHAALRLAGYRISPARLTRAEEAGLLCRADAIVAIQAEEAALIGAMCAHSTVVTVPMPAIAVPRPPGVSRNPDRLVFVGSDTLPNIDGLRWFFEAVWPGLRLARPAIRLDVAGDCGAAIGALPAGARRLGRVADLAPALHRAALAIAPLRAGSGLKVKLLDYARHGLWTVATPAARAGMVADERLPIFLAETPSSFGATILAALVHQPDETDAMDYIERHYAASQVFAPLTDLLER